MSECLNKSGQTLNLYSNFDTTRAIKTPRQQHYSIVPVYVILMRFIKKTEGKRSGADLHSLSDNFVVNLGTFGCKSLYSASLMPRGHQFK